MPESRYEFKPFKYSSHDCILRVLDGEKQPVKILDVGTAAGYLGRVWRAKGHYLCGIEYDPATAAMAEKHYDAFRVADVETYDFPYRQEFDYIVFADVLEHLRDPATVLRRCLPALKDSGKIILSVPNIANWVVRLSLMLGRFDYMERGILDRTHLRFFTMKSLKQLMAEVNCDVERVVATPLPVQLVLPFTQSKLFAPMHAALYALTRSWKTLFAYQFVIVAKPNVARRESPSAASAAMREKQAVAK
jgi:SAM-dependent methyltransferase